jgi:predicted esterase
MRGPVVVFAAIVLAACGSSSSTADRGGGVEEPAGASGPTEPPPPKETPPAPPSTPVNVPSVGTCSDPVPAGAASPPALPTYAGTCPTFAASPAATTITTSGASRTFIVVTPAAIAPNETLPVVFAWHWLGGSANDFVEKLALQEAADFRRLIFVVPDAKGDLFYKWPMMASHDDARLAEDLAFFDDLLACVGAALPIKRHCVATLGVSAGALFSAQLTSARADRLSSFVSVSGGIGDPVRDFAPAARPVPSFLIWGGPTDRFPNPTFAIFDFEKGTNKLAGKLLTGGHALLECVHNCGHDVPPFDAPAPGAPMADALYRFILDNPYWAAAGKSLYTGAALPPAYPAWCALGHGAAVPRVGECP